MKSIRYLWEQLFVTDSLKNINLSGCSTTQCNIAATPASNHTVGRDVVKRYKNFENQ